MIISHTFRNWMHTDDQSSDHTSDPCAGPAAPAVSVVASALAIARQRERPRLIRQHPATSGMRESFCVLTKSADEDGAPGWDRAEALLTDCSA